MRNRFHFPLDITKYLFFRTCSSGDVYLPSCSLTLVTDLKIKSGEVKLESSTFKIDYKVGCFVKEKFVTISCIEVGKFVEPDKVRDDHHKLLLEGKTIINNIIKEFKFIDPKVIPVLGVQICGIKGDLVEIILASKKSYVAHRPLERLRVPLNCNDSDSANTFLRQLLYYKKHLADFSYDLKQMVNNHDDKSASFERVLGGHLFVPPNYIDWIDDCVERL
ncbi:hypothetical protein HPULCUR_009212 [Helicostylum pulchrum]|uniref:Uncharacterized protein n=1 Tax=Helicostylum pulchrum TaxID=562976 RepID=A0ABP9Y9S6_9FUNG